MRFIKPPFIAFAKIKSLRPGPDSRLNDVAQAPASCHSALFALSALTMAQ
jgi:hypothetical protein